MSMADSCAARSCFVQIIELVLVLAALGLILFRSRTFPKPAQSFQVVERWFSQLARRKSLSVLVVGLLVLVSRVALIPVLGIPEPQLARRVQLSSGRRHFRAWPAYQSPPSDGCTLRKFSHH